MRAALDRILALVVAEGRRAADAYMSCAPAQTAPAKAEFVVVSSLAEGADRLIAEAGLAAGFTLDAVLPFHRDDYVLDFETEDSRVAYQDLLQRAAAVFEIDGQRTDGPHAYEAAGLIMLANTDLLIVVWDGNLAAGIGGTAQIISRAVSDGVPIVWIEPAAPEVLHLSWAQAGEILSADAHARPHETFRLADEATLARAVREILAPPTRPEALSALTEYLHTKEPRWNFCPWYSLLAWLFAGRPLSREDFRMPPAVADTRQRWSDYLSILPGDRSQRPAIENILLPACGVADHLANFYSLVYRSTYIVNFLFASLAVGIALNGVFIHEPREKGYFVVLELVFIVMILLTWLHGHRHQWHRRWLECRRLAECLRQLRFFAPLGSAGVVERPRPGLGTEEDWINWYAWTVRRQLPLPDRAIDRPYLESVRDVVLNAEVYDQIRYHERNSARMHKLDHRLHLSGLVLFGATAALCLAFVLLVWLGALDDLAAEPRNIILSSLTFLTALLPTLGASLAAIHAQGEFRTLADQSTRTAKRLGAISKIIAAEEPSFARMVDRVEKTSDVLMAELREWHTIFRTRPLALPA
ncbi:MAG TPA: hypothetical protein VMU69_15395 [Bradyrhizobium sp.]|nr:hypothetical protein [Bradyrhizobium sp.]